MKGDKSKGVLSAEVIQVIKTITVIGNGTVENPNRYETKYWSLEGQLLAMSDGTEDER